MSQEITKPAFTALSKALRDTITAGQAVRDGIATHAEKHKKAMQDAHHKAQQAQRMSVPLARPGVTPK